MASSYPQGQGTGAYINTTTSQDMQLLQTVDLKSEDFRSLLMNLYETIGTLEKSINQRSAGNYPLEEFVTGDVFFPDPALSSLTTQKPTLRQVFRKVIPFCPTPNANLPNNGALIVPHGIDITPNLFFTRIYAIAKNPTGGPNWIPIPWVYPNDVNNSIYIDVNGANVNIRTGDNKTAFTQVIAILEYIKT